MESTQTIIPKRMEGEHVLSYARRLKKAGFIPAEAMDASLYAIAKQQEREEHKEKTEELKNNHACLKCEGKGVVGEKDNWQVCPLCFGSRMETAQEEDLAPQEKELRERLQSMDVYRLKLMPEIIHRIYWYCRAIKKFELEIMVKIFLSRVHILKKEKGFITKQENKTIDCGGYFVSCDAEAVWIYKQKNEDEKKQKNSQMIDEVVPF
jgi:Zn finger protein HypA/HybF involved in hydrogenase expression